MRTLLPQASRCGFPAASAAVGALGMLRTVAVAATRWPDRETAADQSQGVPLAKLQPLVRDWRTDYDWRRVEAKLNALPMFVTEIDGLDIQFIHVRSRHSHVLPLIVTHGGPGSRPVPLKQQS